jgi:protein HOOK3
LRSTLAGKEIPEELKQRLLAMHEDNVLLREQVNSTNEKLTKAKAFIKNQDQLFKAEAAKLTSGRVVSIKQFISQLFSSLRI